MALPTLKKTWQFNTNNVFHPDIAQGSTQAHADKRELLLGIKNAMIAGGLTSPWELRGSSDSSAASLLAVGAGGPGTDRWIDKDDLIWGDNDADPRSWVVLRQTGISATFEVLIDCRQGSNNDDGAHLRVLCSQVGFTGGTTTARPTATDERSLTENGTWGSGASGSDTAPYVMHFMISSDGQCTRIICLDENGTTTGLWLFDVPQNPKSQWTTPYVARVRGNGNAELLTWGIWFDSPNLRTRFNSVDITFYITGEGYANQGLGEALDEANQLDESIWLGDMGLVTESSSFRGRQGELFDMYWTQDFLVTGLTFPTNGTRTFIVFGDMVFPWDGSIPIKS